MAFTISNVKVLNLPEQVQQNKEDIEELSELVKQLEKSINALQSSKES